MTGSARSGSLRSAHATSSLQGEGARAPQRCECQPGVDLALHLRVGGRDGEGRPEPGDEVPHPRAAQRKGNALQPDEVQALLRSFDNDQDRLVFTTLVLTALRRAELQALRWQDIDLIENRLRVVDSKTETGSRSVAISPTLAERLWQHRRTSSYRAESNHVFCHPKAGTVYLYETFSEALRRAYNAAGMPFPEGMRPFHDLRVTSITNDAIAGANPVALMTKAGHASMATTRRYLRLAGTVFPDEAAALEARLLTGRDFPGATETVDSSQHRNELSTVPSTDLSEPQLISGYAASLSQAVTPQAAPFRRTSSSEGCAPTKLVAVLFDGGLLPTAAAVTKKGFLGTLRRKPKIIHYPWVVSD